MTRGEATQIKVHYKGRETENDFVIFIEDLDAMKKFKAGDTTIPLAQVVQSFKVFTSHKQGASGPLDGASDQLLDAEFQTTTPEDVIKKIIELGDVQETEAHARNGPKNDHRGGHTITR